MWSNEPPTETGYYWWRRDMHSRPVVVSVMVRSWDRKEPEVHVQYFGDKEGQLLWWNGEWQGPIAPQEEDGTDDIDMSSGGNASLSRSVPVVMYARRGGPLAPSQEGTDHE
jgi:hypothetical protein